MTFPPSVLHRARSRSLWQALVPLSAVTRTHSWSMPHVAKVWINGFTLGERKRVSQLCWTETQNHRHTCVKQKKRFKLFTLFYLFVVFRFRRCRKNKRILKHTLGTHARKPLARLPLSGPPRPGCLQCPVPGNAQSNSMMPHKTRMKRQLQRASRAWTFQVGWTCQTITCLWCFAVNDVVKTFVLLPTMS